VPTHETVLRALTALGNLEHRGAEGADANTGDGAGITVQIPDAFFRATVDELPPAGAYGIGVCFLPRDDARRAEIEQLVETTIAAEGCPGGPAVPSAGSSRSIRATACASQSLWKSASTCRSPSGTTRTSVTTATRGDTRLPKSYK